jgi:hypothetical protein
MTPEETKAAYIAALKEIIANDPIAGPLYAEREVLRATIAEPLAQVAPVTVQISALTNRINNTASDQVQKALKALRELRSV